MKAANNGVDVIDINNAGTSVVAYAGDSYGNTSSDGDDGVCQYFLLY